MKAKIYLSIRIMIAPMKLSVESAAKEVISILEELGKIDSLFLFPNLTIGENLEVPINLSKGEIEVHSKELAEGILKAEWDDIIRQESSSIPTIKYIRLDGYPVLLRYQLNNKTIFWIGCRIGSNVNQTFTIRGFSSNKLFDFSWYERIFKSLIFTTNAKLGTVVMSNESFGKFYNRLNIKYPIGWITYFSDTYEICIPDDLSEVRYEFVDGGKYLYTSDEDFMKDKEAYFANQEKLQRIIHELKERVPEFVKLNNPSTT
jgi:hypothetical protein